MKVCFYRTLASITSSLAIVACSKKHPVIHHGLNRAHPPIGLFAIISKGGIDFQPNETFSSNSGYVVLGYKGEKLLCSPKNSKVLIPVEIKIKNCCAEVR
jgi:hypothetical protein